MYDIKILSEKEFESLPYPDMDESLGIADPRTNTAYVRYTGIDEMDKYLVSHELDHLIDGSDGEHAAHYENGVYYKKFKDTMNYANPVGGNFMGLGNDNAFGNVMEFALPIIAAIVAPQIIPALAGGGSAAGYAANAGRVGAGMGMGIGSGTAAGSAAASGAAGAAAGGSLIPRLASEFGQQAGMNVASDAIGGILSPKPKTPELSNVELPGGNFQAPQVPEVSQPNIVTPTSMGGGGSQSGSGFTQGNKIQQVAKFFQQDPTAMMGNYTGRNPLAQGGF